jgi:diguanylate cyclase (GGDEF)-like protein/PAS domain S-box-containing protein
MGDEDADYADDVPNLLGGALARRRMIGYITAMGLLSVAYLALPSWHFGLWAIFGLASVAAIGYGTWQHRPSTVLPWVLIGAAVTTFALGDSTYNVLTDVLSQADPFPSAADALYLATFPLFASGLLVFSRRRRIERDRGGLLDALTVTAGLGLLSWVYLIVPYVRSEDLTAAQKAISICYPLGDVLILAMLARLIVGGGLSSRPVQLLIGGAVSLLAADIAYGLTRLYGTWKGGGPIDLGWIAFYTAWGTAALHPDMTELTEPLPARPLRLTRQRLTVLAAASLIAPGVLLSEAATGHTGNAAISAVGAGFAAVLFLLVIGRLWGMVAAHSAAVARERALRAAAARLATADDPAAVWNATRGAVASVVRVGSPNGAAVAIAAPAERHLDGDVPLVVGQRLAEHLTSHDQVASLRGGEALGLTNGQYDMALICPLGTAERLLGSVVVGGDAVVLAGVRPSLETLVAQSAITLERVTLGQELLLRRSETRFRSLIQSASDIILVLDPDGSISYQTPSAAAILGHDPATLQGRQILDLVHPEDREVAQATVRRVLRGALIGQPDWRLITADGDVLEVEIHGNDLTLDPDVLGIVLTMRDVTDSRRLERELRHQTFHDTLTGLPNRELFRNRVEHALDRVRDGAGVVGVMVLDIDDFMVINDSRGHESGDQLLVSITDRLRSALRSGDTAARLGGDEFGILVENAASVTGITAAVDRVVAAVRGEFLLESGAVRATVSAGVATSFDAEGATELLRCADLALYAAKDHGKDGWRGYESGLHSGIVHRLETRAGLMRAMVNDEFVLHFQPVVRIDGGQMIGVEALIRWIDPERGTVPPADFIPLAEETGLIIEIGEWVLRSALEQVVEWSRRTPGEQPMMVSVNVSPRQLTDSDFVQTVSEALRDFPLPPDSLTLELTEGVLLRNDSAIATTMTSLRELGVRLAIDDFGTGYSALGYLRDFPVTAVKIDRSFTSQLPGTAQQSALVEAIVRIADSLNLTVIAEGIESAEQAQALLTLGCPLGQGYLYSRPVPAVEFDALLANSPKIPTAEPVS